jgi:phosphoglycolate phosphatase
MPRKLHPDYRVILFDIDGTLLRATRGREYRELIGRMLVNIFGTEGRLSEVDFSGRTDISIYREALESAGVDAALILRKAPDIEAASADIIRRMSDAGDAFYLCNGVRNLLEALQDEGRCVSTVLTGNFETLANCKLQAVGIGSYFRVRGAYGSDHEDRNELPAIAARRFREQFGEPVPPWRMTIVGDTPRDIGCARHHGARVVAVATGHHSMEQLRPCGPDALLPDLSRTDEVVQLLSSL